MADADLHPAAADAPDDVTTPSADRRGADPTTSSSDGQGDDEGQRRGRRRWPWVLLAVVLVAAAAGVTVALLAGGEEEAAATAPAPPPMTTTVERRDIVTTTTLAGTVTYRDDRSIAADLDGTITALPEVGATIAPGEALYAIDGVAVPVLPGDLPLWRELSVDSDDGQDVLVLEQALVDLGYADPDEVTVDEEFTAETADAVEAMREDLGLPEGDTIAPGAVVVLPGAVRVAGLDLDVGARIQAGVPVMTVTGTTRVVEVDLDAGDQGLLAVDDAVEVELPDDTTVAGTVTRVSPVAEARGAEGPDAEPTYVIPVEVTLGEGAETFDEAPVDVVVADEVAADVLAVPVEAVLALAEGGYALEVVEDGATRLVAVELGDFADGWVEVRGDGIAEGTEVVRA